MSTTTRPVQHRPPVVLGPELAEVRSGRATALILGLAVALVVIGIVAAGNGQLNVPADEVLGSILHHLGLDLGPIPSHPQGDAALWNVRFPRVVMAMLLSLIHISEPTRPY